MEDTSRDSGKINEEVKDTHTAVYMTITVAGMFSQHALYYSGTFCGLCESPVAVPTIAHTLTSIAHMCSQSVRSDC